MVGEILRPPGRIAFRCEHSKLHLGYRVLAPTCSPFNYQKEQSILKLLGPFTFCINEPLPPTVLLHEAPRYFKALSH